MKKVYIIVVMISLLITCFVSCAQEPPTDELQTTEIFQTGFHTDNETETQIETEKDIIIINGAFLENLSAWQYGFSGASGLPIEHKNNFSYSEYDFKDESAAKTRKVKIDGKEYELTYQESSEGPLYQDTIHKYSDGTVDQWINADTGQCVYYYKRYRSTDAEACSKEEQLSIAYAFLESQVVHPEQYEITRETYISSSGGLYIDFSRMVSGIVTCDQVKVRVNKAGVITLYKLEFINEMSNVESIPDKIIQNAYVALDNEVQSIYRQLSELHDYRMTYQAEIDRLVRLDNGCLAFDCHVDVKISTPDGETLSDGAWFIIPITEPTVQAE